LLWENGSQAAWDSAIPRETVVRQTQVALALQIWKRQHDQWPESLEQLLEIRGQGAPRALSLVSSLVDPWSGEPFQYRGGMRNKRDPSTGYETLVCSVGHEHLRPVFSDKPPKQGGFSPSGIWVLNKTWRGNLRPFTANADDRCRLDVVEDKLVMRLPHSPNPSTAGITLIGH
jgi:hypothetical protein